MTFTDQHIKYNDYNMTRIPIMLQLPTVEATTTLSRFEGGFIVAEHQLSFQRDGKGRGGAEKSLQVEERCTIY